jgi:hypothetical protein
MQLKATKSIFNLILNSKIQNLQNFDLEKIE